MTLFEMMFEAANEIDEEERLRQENDRLRADLEAIGAGGVGAHRITKPAAYWTPTQPKEQSDGSTAGYYTLPRGATELQELIAHRNMNAQIGEIFRACYRYGLVEHSPEIRDIKKIIFYAQAELERLEKLEEVSWMYGQPITKGE